MSKNKSTTKTTTAPVRDIEHHVHKSVEYVDRTSAQVEERTVVGTWPEDVKDQRLAALAMANQFLSGPFRDHDAVVSKLVTTAEQIIDYVNNGVTVDVKEEAADDE